MTVTFRNVPDAPLPAENLAQRFWAKDPTLWPSDDAAAVAGMLGWTDVLPKMRARLPELAEIVAESKAAGDAHVVLAGMGGSSLAPFVLAEIFGPQEDGLPLTVLDSTHPDTVRETLEGVDREDTLVLISSKSGSTAEPNAFARTFEEALGAGRMIAITDRGSPFDKASRERGYRRTVIAYSDIGGRYSALSPFGLVPAALMGLDVERLIAHAEGVVEENRADDGPAFRLGAAMGELAKEGVDKLTILAAPGLGPVGLWLEQLVAESTGKAETGVFPIAGERVGAPDRYGRDRFFLVVRDADRDEEFETAVSALVDAGRPVVELELADNYDLAALWMTTEIATAVSGAVLGINPFDQPDVESAKIAARERLEKPAGEAETPALTENGIFVFGDDCSETLAEVLKTFLGATVPGEFVVLQAYLHETEELSEALEELQAEIRDRTGRATAVGYGPRFLHSTGQFHKGGTNSGLFVQLTDDPTADLDVPGQKATYGVFIQAQADGDRDALLAKGRRILRLHLGNDAPAGVARLTELAGAL